jgi:hypothetical protein
MRSLSRLAGLATVALSLGAPRPASAESDPHLALALLVLVGGTVVAPGGAMVTTLEGEPTKEWGRASLVFGGIAGVTGTALTIAGALSPERDQTTFYVVGGVALGLGLNGLIWGLASEATLPAEDGAIGGEAQAASAAPSMLSFGGTF